MIAKLLSQPVNYGASYHIITSIICHSRYQLERQLLGGIRTRYRKAPFHDARQSWATRLA